MNVLTGLGLYLALFFVMIVLALLNILPVNYLGGIIIALFIGGLFYAWLNAWRQTSKLVKVESHEEVAEGKPGMGRPPPQFESGQEQGESKQKKELRESEAAQVTAA